MAMDLELTDKRVLISLAEAEALVTPSATMAGPDWEASVMLASP